MAGVVTFQDIIQNQEIFSPIMNSTSCLKFVTPYVQPTMNTSTRHIKTMEIEAEYQSNNWIQYIPPCAKRLAILHWQYEAKAIF